MWNVRSKHVDRMPGSQVAVRIRVPCLVQSITAMRDMGRLVMRGMNACDD